MTERPGSFDSEVVWDWVPWVLEHGLPALPDVLGPGSGAPVAVFRSRTRAAVLLLVYNSDDDDEPFVDSEAIGFRRTAVGWEEANGSGGGSWSEDFRLARSALKPARSCPTAGPGRQQTDGPS